MGLASNAMRVCLSRLKAGDFVECDARGWYRLGPAARSLSEELANWRQRESQTLQWRGAWIAAHLDRLPSAQRKRQRQQARALALLGFREWRPGLAVRPDNLRKGVEGVRARLHALGFAAQQPVFVMSGLEDEAQAALPGLWDLKTLNLSYRKGLAALELSRKRAARLSLDKAGAETFRVGGDALRSLAFDPLLPAPLVEVSSRKRYAAAVQSYDELGRHYWSQILEAPLSSERSTRTGKGAGPGSEETLQQFSSQLES